MSPGFPDLGWFALCAAFRDEDLPLSGGVMHAAREVLSADTVYYLTGRCERIELSTDDRWFGPVIRRTTRNTVSAWRAS